MPPYRGRLIFPFTLEIAQLDLGATQTAGYDPDFREAGITSTPDGLGQSNRAETIIQIPGQQWVKSNSNNFMALKEMSTGNVASVQLLFVLHFADLEAAGLIEESTGLATIKVGDRLSAIYDSAGNLVQMMPPSPGVFITEAMPVFGLNGIRNLLEITFTSRDPGGSAG